MPALLSKCLHTFCAVTLPACCCTSSARRTPLPSAPTPGHSMRPVPAFPEPLPVPEPPRVVYTRSLVPDVSLTSEMGSCAALSPALHHTDAAFRGLAVATASPLTRYNVTHPLMKTGIHSTPTPSSGRQPLKPIQRTSPLSPAGSRLPVVRHQSDGQSAAGMDRMCKLIEKHDEQLQLISQQIETLLRLQKEISDKPITCNAETMTSKIWSPSHAAGNGYATPSEQRSERRASSSGKSETQSSGRGILRKTVTHETTCTEQSIECGRLCDEEPDHTFFHTMLSDISDILSRSSETDDSFHTRPSPVKRPRTAVKHVVTDSAEERIGSETIYINRLAAKYLSHSDQSEKQPAGDPRHQAHRNVQSQPQKHRHRKAVQSETRNDVTSIATKNYMQRYGFCSGRAEPSLRTSRQVTNKPKNRLLDLSNRRLPKFV